MSHLLNSVNNVKASNAGNIDLSVSSFLSSSSNDNIMGIDGNGDAKNLSGGASVGDLATSCICPPSVWGGSPTVTEGYNIFMGYAGTFETNTSLCTMHLHSAGFILGWTLVPGDYLMFASWAFGTASGGDCNAQFYNATTANYVGPKIHFETGRFSNRLMYYASISSSTRFEIRARDVNGVAFFDNVSQTSCILQVLKV